MTAYPAQFYRDPSDLVDAIRRQQCDGCHFEEVMQIAGKRVRSCFKSKKHSDNGGNRCDDFKRKGAGNAVK